MDNSNPWGQPDAESGSPTRVTLSMPAPTPPLLAESPPALLVEQQDVMDRAGDVMSGESPMDPDWDASSRVDKEPSGEDEQHSDEVGDVVQQEEDAVAETDKPIANAAPTAETPEPQISEQADGPTSSEPQVDDAAEQVDTTPEPKAPTLSMDIALPDQGPPMDNFPDDDIDEGFGQDDDFDDFGEAAEAGDTGDDFADFGDFDAGDGQEMAETGFGSDAGFSMNAPVPQPPPPQQLGTTWTGFEPLKLDLSDTSRAVIGDQLRSFFEAVYPNAQAAVSDEPERQVEGVAQVLVTEPLRAFLSNLSSMPPLRPLDWRRSRVRREHLIAMGVPVNLDESLDAKPLASLVLPSTNASPIGRSDSPHGLRSASPASPSVPFQPPSRSSTPFADRERARQAAQAPTINRTRAEELCAMAPVDLNLLPVARLRALEAELDQISRDASNVLTHALMAREKESADAETYHEMIQDLVTAAAKVKTTTGRASTPPIRSASGRFGRK